MENTLFTYSLSGLSLSLALSRSLSLSLALPPSLPPSHRLCDYLCPHLSLQFFSESPVMCCSHPFFLLSNDCLSTSFFMYNTSLATMVSVYLPVPFFLHIYINRIIHQCNTHHCHHIHIYFLCFFPVHCFFLFNFFMSQ